MSLIIVNVVIIVSTVIVLLLLKTVSLVDEQYWSSQLNRWDSPKHNKFVSVRFLTYLIKVNNVMIQH